MPQKIQQGKGDKEYDRKDAILYRQSGETFEQKLKDMRE